MAVWQHFWNIDGTNVITNNVIAKHDVLKTLREQVDYE